MAAQPRALTPAEMMQVNMTARGLVLSQSIKMTQQVYTASVTPATQNVLQIAPRNVGLIQGFIVEVSGSIINNGMTTAADRTTFGMMNALTNIQFQDLNNNVRINTSGRSLAILNTMRQGFGYGGAYAPNLPSEMGQNGWSVQTGPSSIAAGVTSAVRQIYWVPLARSATDLRGAIWANVTNATMNLQLTINPSPVALSGDPLNKCYVGNTGAWSGAVTINVYQVYRDQLPRDGNNSVILPPLDLNTIYELIETTLTGVAANQDFPYSFANFREFQGVIAFYDNNGVFNTGSDVSYWSLTAANSLNIFKIAPEIAALQARSLIMGDPTDGTYLFDFSDRPINTRMFGNMQLNLNALTATNANVIVQSEAFADINMISGASSLAAG